MFSQHFEQLATCMQYCQYTTEQGALLEKEAMQLAKRLLMEVEPRSGIVYVLGNGGSAGIASHFSNDLMKSAQVPSHTLYDTNLLTCLANDIGYQYVFSYPLNKVMTSSDLLVAISSSGKSASILNAVEVARAKAAPIITLSGFSASNPLRASGALNFWIDRENYGLVEMAHFFILHTIIDHWSTVCI
jgi:D-sedoheptulose 7-phosphate isomerase